jgi:hypothetical protein
MNNRAEFESSVSVYVVEAKRFNTFVFRYHFVAYAWILLLFLERPVGSSTAKFVLLVIVCPVLIVGGLILRATKVDSVARAVGLRCPECGLWLSGKISGAYARETGKCRRCGATIFEQ